MTCAGGQCVVRKFLYSAHNGVIRGMKAPQPDQRTNGGVKPASCFFFNHLGPPDHFNNSFISYYRLPLFKGLVDFCQLAWFPGVPVAVHALEHLLQFCECAAGLVLRHAPELYHGNGANTNSSALCSSFR